MRIDKTIYIYTVLLLLIFLTGCWDRKEIEDVGIVLGIGLDKSEKNELNQQSISMLHQFAIPKQFASKDTGGSQKDYLNLVSEGTPVFKNIRELSTRSDRLPSYEHLRIIVISQGLARNIDLKRITNFLLRNTDTRRSIRVVIDKGNAKDIFEKHGISTNPSLVLRALSDNYKTSLMMPHESKLGDISEKLTGKTSFIVPGVETTYAEAKFAGAAVIKGNLAKMIGWLNEEEVTGLNLLKGEKKQNGIINGTDPKSGEAIVYEIRTIKSKIKPIFKGNRISFEVEINTMGKLREDWVDPGNAFESEFIKRAEQATEASIREAVSKTLSKIQKNLRVDVAGFGTKLRIKNPRAWNKLIEDWDEEFSEMQVEVKVNVKIQEFGTKGAKKG
ncbi:Ger(x)C family spore germination protein [Paenibacillus ottowii]